MRFSQKRFSKWALGILGLALVCTSCGPKGSILFNSASASDFDPALIHVVHSDKYAMPIQKSLTFDGLESGQYLLTVTGRVTSKQREASAFDPVVPFYLAYQEGDRLQMQTLSTNHDKWIQYDKEKGLHAFFLGVDARDLEGEYILSLHKGDGASRVVSENVRTETLLPADHMCPFYPNQALQVPAASSFFETTGEVRDSKGRLVPLMVRSHSLSYNTREINPLPDFSSYFVKPTAYQHKVVDMYLFYLTDGKDEPLNGNITLRFFNYN